MRSFRISTLAVVVFELILVAISIHPPLGIRAQVIRAMALAGVGSSFLILVTFLPALIHEAGHAIAWTLVGARVREVGCARPHGPAIRIRVGRLTVAFNPISIFAYTLIEGSEKQLSPTSRLQRIFVHGAGIGANLLVAAVGLAFSDPLIHLFAGSSATLAIQNILFQDGRRIFAALSRS